MSYMFKVPKVSQRLKETKNLMELWLHAAGKTEVPTAWHRWCCISTIAAACRDNVWYQKFAHERLAPNMYTFLIGPSGVGKGIAIGFAQQFRHPSMNVMNGTATHKALIDQMASEPSDDKPEPWKMWLIHTELANDVGEGPLASAFVKAMTDWYNPSSTPFVEGTRKHGYKEIRPPVMNWLAGSTTEWLGQTIDGAALNSGFFGRVAAAPGRFNPDVRIYDPMEYSPPDYNEVIGHIFDRLDDITRLEGVFKLDPIAREIDRNWYETRASPEPGMEPFWRREQDLRYKVAMCASLCDSTNLIISADHLSIASGMVKSSAQAMPGIIQNATASKTSNNMKRIYDIVQSASHFGITRAALTKKVSRQCDARELNMHIGTLLSSHVIEESVGSDNRTKRYFFCPDSQIDFSEVNTSTEREDPVC